MEPLVQYLDSRGGLETFFQQTYEPSLEVRPLNYTKNDTRQAIPPELWTEYERTRQGVRRATKRGEVEFFWADTLCCLTLKVHPALVFGEHYWNVPYFPFEKCKNGHPTAEFGHYWGPDDRFRCRQCSRTNSRRTYYKAKHDRAIA